MCCCRRASWAEKDGCWENYAGKIQPFDAAVAPPNDSMREGDVYYKLLGKSGFYNADDVRAEMGEPFASVKLPSEHAPSRRLNLRRFEEGDMGRPCPCHDRSSGPQALVMTE